MTFTGRDQELGRLMEVVDASRSGSGSFVTISGPAGIGRTALLGALAAQLDGSASVLTCACDLDGDPFRPLRQILIEASHRLGREIPAKQIEDARNLSEFVDLFLETLLSLPAPIVLLMDDVHQADEATLSLLQRVVANLPEEPVVVVATMRSPRGAIALYHLPRAHLEITLGGLTVDDVAQRLTDVLAMEPGELLDSFAYQLHGLTGGNPGFVEADLELMVAGELAPDPEGKLSGGLVGSEGQKATMVDELGVEDQELLFTAWMLRGLRGPTVRRACGTDVAGLAAATERARSLNLVGAAVARSGSRTIHNWVADLLAERMSEGQMELLQGRIAHVLVDDVSVPVMVTLQHAMEAGDSFDAGELAGLAERAGFESLERFAFDDANRFLGYAAAHVDDDLALLRCTLGRARALQRLGDLERSGEVATDAWYLASRLELPEAMLEAALIYGHAPEWRSTDATVSRLLAEVPVDGLSVANQSRLLAGRAIAEMRVPVGRDGPEEWSWITRPVLAQPLAQESLKLARASGDEAALLSALLAWRDTHRGAAVLEERRRISAEASTLAQQLGDLDRIVEAGLRQATDEAQAGNRRGFEEAVILCGWAADRSREPRLRWKALYLEGTRAGLDGNVDAMAEAREKAAALGYTPGRHVSDVVQLFQEYRLRGRLNELVTIFDLHHPAMAHPLGRAAGALFSAEVGLDGQAVELLQSIHLPLDPESSDLMTAWLAAKAALAVGSKEQAAVFLSCLEPWSQQVAVDSEAMWIGGPIALVTSKLHKFLGDDEAATQDRDMARQVNAGLLSVPTMTLLSEPNRFEQFQVPLTARELDVLVRMVAGRSNAQIAVDLNFSLATIRRETTSIYRKFGVVNRAEAAAEAVARGLVSV